MFRRLTASLLAAVLMLGVTVATFEGLLQRRLELYLNGAWVDFSDRLLTQTLSPNPGRTSGGNTVSPSTLNFSLDNPLGDITPYNAASNYFPYVDVGMQVRWSVYWDGNWYVRGVFEATDVEPHWPYGDLSDGTTTGQPGESYVAIQAADILQRLSDNQREARSALHRAILADGPAQFWPFEEEAGAASAASALSSGVPMAVIGGPTFGDSDAPAGGAGAAVDIEGGSLKSANFTLPASGGYTLELCAKLTGTPVASTDNLWRLRYPTFTLSLDADEIAEDGEWHHILFQEEQVGADVVREIWKDGVLSFTFTFVGTTLTCPVGVQFNLEYPNFSSPLKLTYAAIHAHANVDAAARYQAMLGWVSETAGRRIERLLAESDIAFTSSGDLDETVPMGVQPNATLIEVLRDCEETDLGILHAQREAVGLHYRTRADLYNQDPALVLDASANELANPFRPSATAKHIVNDVTVDRPDGSSARAINQSSIDKVGPRPRSYNANTETDNQLADAAGWLLNLGTPDGMHYPSVSSELTIASQLIEDWLALNLGDRIQVVNLPPQHPADTVDLIVAGYTEPHSPTRWAPQINCTPAAPWTVAVLDDDDLGKLDTAGCVMQSAATSGATSFTVATTVLPKWTTDAGEMPIPILVSGQVNSVTAISNVSPAFVAAGTVAHANNASVTPTMPAGVQAGDLLLVLAAIRNSGTGTVNTPSGYTVLLTSGNMTLLGKVHTGTESAPTITYAGGVANADTSAQMCAFRGTGITVHASTAQLNASAQNVAYPQLDISRDNCVVVYVGWKQDDWTSVTGPGTEIGEPDTTTGDDQGIVWAYTIQTTAARIATGSFTVTGGASAISRGGVIALATDVQTMTVTRGTNGVTKAIPIGSQVNVYRPARLAL